MPTCRTSKSRPACAAVLRAAEIGQSEAPGGPGAVYLDRDGDGAAPYMAQQQQEQQPRAEQRTLYDVLRCSPAATREELKASYVALARLSHPDAVIQSSPDEDDGDERPDFNEVARAYKTLSDRKSRLRYDRELKAARISSEVESAASDAFSAAYRAARGAVGTAGSGAKFVAETAARVARPIGRRVKAGASAAAQAAGRELSPELRERRDRSYAAHLGRDSGAEGGSGPGTGPGGSGRVGLSAGEHIGSALKSAVAASKDAARAVDALELLERAEELERAAEFDAALSNALRAELSDMAKFRTQVTLSTPTADLSSVESRAVFDALNATDELSAFEKIFKVRKTLGEEIALLEEAERAHYDACSDHYNAQKRLEEDRAALDDVERTMTHAGEAEGRAAMAVDKARDLVGSNMEAVGRRDGRFGSAAKAVDNAESDLRRAEATLAERRERVRVGLSGKGEEIGYADGSERGAFATPTETSTSRIEELSRRGRSLAAELMGVESKAARLRSRAAKLAARAEIMEAMEEDEGTSTSKNIDRAQAGRKGA